MPVIGPVKHGVPAASTTVVRVAPRRIRLLVLTLLVVGVIVAFTVVALAGFELSRFDASAKSPTEQTQLLDDFNAYSAYVAAAFGTPLEMFVAMAVQVAVLRLLAKQLTQPESSWRMGLVGLTATAAVGYLVSNGFNALNVQLRPQDPTIVIAKQDLATAVASVEGSATTTASLSELTPGNPAINTMLRNVLLPSSPRLATTCPSTYSRNEAGEVPDHFLNRALPRRDWFGRVLPQAPTFPTSRSLQVVLNPTTPSANDNVRASDLPVKTTVAAELVLYAMLNGRWFYNTGDDDNSAVYRDDSAILERNPQFKNTLSQMPTAALAEITGLVLPTNDTATSESMQQETLLRESVAMATRQFRIARMTKPSDIGMTFSHVDISSSVSFDAVTFEFEIDSESLANAGSSDNTTRFTNLDTSTNCGPWPGLCLVEKVSFKSLKSSLLEMPAQVKALSPCVDKNGIERLHVEVNNTGRGLRMNPLCTDISNTSMLVFSFAKRLVADAITQDTVRNATGSFTDETKAVVTNLRKIYTFTVGRLAWTFEDLAASNHAQCVTYYGNCLGLQLPLAPEANASTNGTQHLVVSATALPTHQFLPLGAFELRPRFVNLVEAYEPEGNVREVALGGDPLLVHNIGQVDWSAPLEGERLERCDTRVEDRLRLIVNNHYYSEHSLQPAYTAATWFLFQNAVVKQTLMLPDGRETLDFAANVQRVAVWISTPQTSAFLTLAGCFLLAVGLLASVGKAYCQGTHHPLSTITDPHVIARVLVDDEQFPPRLLKRRVVEENGVRTDVEERVVASLTLRPVDEKENPGKQP